jgi:tRNA(fMet)-specific endonuclease VapC
MRYLLDTNTCICYLNQADSAVRRRLERTPRQDVTTCSIVLAELYFGAWHSARREANLTLVSRFAGEFSSLAFDLTAAEVYGRIRSELSIRGEPIGPNDLLIASIALANGLSLVTHNLREFQRVPGLELEDWEL